MPSQRSMISRLGPLSRRAFSGMCRTRDGWLFSLSRQPTASRGRLLSSGVLTFYFLGRVGGPEGARRRPAGADVGEVQSVELRPQNVALRSKRAVGLVLFLARPRMLHDPVEGEVRIFRRLRKPAGEIV